MPQSSPETWQVPMRELGYRLISDKVKKETGVQGQYHGTKLVDGNWYCPAIPEPLVVATTEHDRNLIPDDPYDVRLLRRSAYILREKEGPGPSGSMRYKCPAIGPGATCECPLRKRDVNPSKRRRVKIIDVPQEPREICTQSSVSIPVTAAAKYAQQGPQSGTPVGHRCLA